MKLSSEHEAMRRQALAEQQRENDCWLPDGSACHGCRFDGHCTIQGSHRQKISKDIHCNFCGGELGDVEHQVHSNPNFAEYRTCLKCGYQWAKEYWAWLARVQGVEA